MFLLLFPQDWSGIYWHQRRYHGDQNIWKVREVCEIPKMYQSARTCDSEVSVLLCLVRYKLLHVLEFDAIRRRMSVILQAPSGNDTFICFSH